MSKRIIVVMPYYDRQWQLDRTLETMALSKYDNFGVVIVDDCSPQPIAFRQYIIPHTIVRLNNPISTNAAPIINTGILKALELNPDIIVIQSPECYHVGDVISHASTVTDKDYIAFGCFRLDMSTTFQNHSIKQLIERPFRGLTEDPGIEGINMWYNHPKWQPNGFHWCVAITTENLIKLNGFDESFSFGYGREDGYFITQVKNLGLNVTITERPFVVHQWHTQRQYKEDMGLLVMRNQMIYDRLMLLNDYKAKHILTDDLASRNP
jgi:glycosyltransferase involved in cell wall biosynthesis